MANNEVNKANKKRPLMKQPAGPPPASFDRPESQPLDKPAGPVEINCPPPAQVVRRRPWPVTALGLLLLLQALGLFSFGLFHFEKVNLLARSDQPLGVTGAELLAEITQSSLISLVFIPLSLLALVTGIGFLRLWRIAWLNAVLIQGLSLGIAIIFYLQHQPAYVYAIMLYSIFMVIYLHHSEVQSTFNASMLEESSEE